MKTCRTLGNVSDELACAAVVIKALVLSLSDLKGLVTAAFDGEVEAQF